MAPGRQEGHGEQAGAGQDRRQAPTADHRPPCADVGHLEGHAFSGGNHGRGVRQFVQVHAPMPRSVDRQLQGQKCGDCASRQPGAHPPAGGRAQQKGAEQDDRQQGQRGETRAAGDPLETSLGQHRLDQLGVAALRDEQAPFVAMEGPLVDHAGRQAARSDEGHGRGRRPGGLPETQRHGDGLIGIYLCRERYERLVAVGAGVDQLVLHARFPKLDARGQYQAQRFAASGFYEELGVRHNLAVPGHLAG